MELLHLKLKSSVMGEVGEGARGRLNLGSWFYLLQVAPYVSSKVNFSLPGGDSVRAGFL